MSATVLSLAVIKAGAGGGLSDTGGVSCDPRRVTTETFLLVCTLSVFGLLDADGSCDGAPPQVQLVASSSEHSWVWYPLASLRLRSPVRSERADTGIGPDAVEVESNATAGCAGAGSCWIRLASRPLTSA